MNRTTWTDARATIFARGLYHVAACDGLDPREERALSRFLAQVGLEAKAIRLAEVPFDYAEAAAVLDSTWLRRTMIHACRIMVQLDGEISAPERDALRAMGAALGVGERFALQGLDGELPDPEHLVNWMRGLAVDYVSWDDDHQPGYFWRFPHPAHALAFDAPLIVERGQALVVRRDGATTDVLGPGEHQINPEHLPGLMVADGFEEDGAHADLLFVRTGPSPRLRWGTGAPVVVGIEGHGQVPLRIYGRFSIRFRDAGLVVDRMASQGLPTNAEVEQRLRRIVTGRFAHVLSAMDDLTVRAINDLDRLCTRIRKALDAPLAHSGLHLARFDIENLTGPLEVGLEPTSKHTQNLNRTAASSLAVSAPDGGSPMRTTEMAPCVGCGISLPTSARFCTGCGASQRKTCRGCGAALPTTARFCSRCGEPQSAPQGAA